MKENDIKRIVKKRYSEVAKKTTCCGGSTCCPLSDEDIARTIGYSDEEINTYSDANLGLGCGNPTAIGMIKKGETVLDLGSGAGIDVFLAANRIGPTGKVIGVDMTEEMVNKARDAAKNHGYHNVEFRLGEIEWLPVEDESADVIISNCVINLVPDKSKVFQEAYRVLKSGGRITVSDKVTEGKLPNEIRNDPDAWAACVAGALKYQEYLDKIKEAGFKNIQVVSSEAFYVENKQGQSKEKLLNITVKAYK